MEIRCGTPRYPCAGASADSGATGAGAGASAGSRAAPRRPRQQRQSRRTAAGGGQWRLRAALDDHAKERNKRDVALKARLSQDLARLRNGVAIETKVRWREDAELATAMNGYIEKIQQSLYIVNSDIGVPE